YHIYIAAIARLNSEKGRYKIAGDTIYLFDKKRKDIVELKGYALQDTATHSLLYVRTTDSNFTKNFRLHYFRPVK
ncbi:MAG: hypothetical protein ABI688_03060, partial [Bacteroidota bacterium]